MFDRSVIASDLRSLLRIAGPMTFAQLGAMMMGVVDLLMLGRVGVHELDAASLGNVWIFGTMIFGMGLTFGLDPIISQAHGAGKPEQTGVALQRGIVVSLVASVPLIGLWLLTEEVLLLSGQDPGLAHEAEIYTLVQIPSLPLFLVFFATRVYLQGRNITAPILWVTVLANGFNVLGNWVLIFGNLGLPALGLVGAGLASCATRSFLLIGLVVWIWRAGLHRGAWQPWSRQAFDRAGILAILRHGVPVAFQFLLEAWAFQISTLMAGRLDKHALAAHSIVLSIASLAFMVPLGISIGAAVRVGNLIGARDDDGARRMAWLSISLGGAVMLISAALFVLFRHQLPGLYNDDPEVLAFAASILPIAAAFQLFDGIQVVGGGVLRGYGNTRPAAIFNVIGFYVLSLPFAAYLTFYLDVGLPGIWWGLVLGLGVVSILLLLWIRLQSRRPQSGSDSPETSTT